MKDNAATFDFIENLDNSAAVIDASNTIIKINKKLKSETRLFNFTQDVTNVPYLLDKENWQKSLNSCFTNGSSDFILKSGSHKCVMMRIATEAGKFALVSFLPISLTENYVVSDNVKMADINTTKTAQMKEFYELASHIAHEINNPLAVISSRSQMLNQALGLQEPITNERLTYSLEKIYQQTERIKKIIKGMRTLTKHPAEKNKYVDCDLNLLIDMAYEQVQANLLKNGIEFVFSSGQEKRPIRCEPSELVEVFVNLFNNSIEALAATTEPLININFEEDSSHIHLFFSDNGPGVKQSLVHQIFTAFFTTKQGASAAEGMGLSVARKIARSYGGDITLKTARGSSCFNISLSKEHIGQHSVLNLEEFKKVS